MMDAMDYIQRLTVFLCMRYDGLYGLYTAVNSVLVYNLWLMCYGLYTVRIIGNRVHKRVCVFGLKASMEEELATAYLLIIYVAIVEMYIYLKSAEPAPIKVLRELDLMKFIVIGIRLITMIVSLCYCIYILIYCNVCIIIFTVDRLPSAYCWLTNLITIYTEILLYLATVYLPQVYLLWRTAPSHCEAGAYLISFSLTYLRLFRISYRHINWLLLSLS